MTGRSLARPVKPGRGKNLPATAITLTLILLTLASLPRPAPPASAQPPPPPLARLFTVSATGPATEFRAPAGIAFDSGGHAWVVDTANHRVVKLSQQGDVLDVIGGRGSAEGRFQSPLGIAVAPGGDIFVADTGNVRIQRFAADGRFIAAWGGRGEACNTFGGEGGRGPTDVAVGPDGIVTVADDSHRLLQFTSEGECVRGWSFVESAASQPAALPRRTAKAMARMAPTALLTSYRYLPFNVAVDTVDGSVFAAFGDGIRHFTSKGYFLNSIAAFGVSPGRLTALRGGLGIGAGGTLWVADGPFDRVQQFRAEGGFLSWFEAPFGQPQDIAVGPDGRLFVTAANYDARGVVVRATAEGHKLDRWGSDAVDFNLADGPQSLAIAPGGDVWVSDRAHDRILRYTADGAYLGAWGGAGRAPGRFASPGGMGFLPNGRRYVADTDNHRIAIFDADGRPIAAPGELGSGDGQFNRPSDVAVTSARYVGDVVIVADTGNNRIVQLNRWGGYETASDPRSDGYTLNAPAGVAAQGETVLIADTGNHRIVRTDQALRQERTWGRQGAGNGEFERPADVAIGPDDAVYVADTGNHRIQKFTPGGAFVTTWGRHGTLDGQFDRPGSVAVGADGSVFVADRGNHRVQRFTADGRHVRTWSMFGRAEGDLGGEEMGSNLNGIAAAPDGSFYVGGWRDESVQQFDPSGRFVRRLRMPGAGTGDGHGVNAVAVGPDGVVFAAIYNHNRIERYSKDGKALGGWDAPPRAGYDWPVDIDVAPDGTVFLLFDRRPRVERRAADGRLLGEWALTPPAPNNASPAALDIGPDGSIHVGDRNSDTVERFDPFGRSLSRWAIQVGPFDAGPEDLAVAPDGSVYVATAFTLLHYAPGGDRYTSVLPKTACGAPVTGRPFDTNVRHLAVRPDGSLLLAWQNFGCVDVVAPAPDPRWRIEFFANPWLAERPVAIADADALDFDWGANSPDGRFVPPDGFSTRAERAFRADRPTRIDLVVRITGGARLWVDDRIWIDDWHAAAITTTLDVTVDAGDHRIVVEYRDTSAAAALHVAIDLAPAAAPPTATSTLRVPTATPVISATPTRTRRPPTATATATQRPPTATPDWRAVVYLPVAGRAWIR